MVRNASNGVNDPTPKVTQNDPAPATPRVGTGRLGNRSAETEHDPFLEIPVARLKSCPDNDTIYGPTHDDDPEVVKLAIDIKKRGIREPIIVSEDDYVISGHRRLAAARVARLEAVPCQVEPITYEHDRVKFLELLRAMNLQRVKSASALICEAVIDAADSEASFTRLDRHRKAAVQSQGLDDVSVEIGERRRKRSKISDAKRPMLDAMDKVINGMRRFWPLTTRLTHYGLLNDPPLKHRSKPDSTYKNDKLSYKNLSDLLLRARIEEMIPWEAIDDATRPISVWDAHDHVGLYVEAELEKLFKNYWRNLQQSQPRHIEIIGEKNTIASIIRPVASEFGIPMTLGRGYCSGSPRQKLVKRFQKSGKEMLVLITVSDFDPEGDDIPDSFAQSLREDFGIPRERVRLVPAALTYEQTVSYKLPKLFTAKKKSARKKKFVRKYGDVHVHELEALKPEDLQSLLRRAINTVMDVDLYNRERQREQEEAPLLDKARLKAIQAIAPLLRRR